MNFEKQLNRNDIINRIHNKQCIFIEEHSNNKYELLPCGCKLCNYLLFYLLSFNYKRHFICRCLKEYRRPDMIKLGILFLALKQNKTSLRLKEYFNKRLTDNCCSCGCDFQNKTKFEIKHIVCKYYNKYNFNEKHLNYFLNIINHYQCEKCFKDKKEMFFCVTCHISHQINNN